MAKRKIATVYCIFESKLDRTVLHSETHIKNYKMLSFKCNDNDEVNACYIRSNISCRLNSFLPN